MGKAHFSRCPSIALSFGVEYDGSGNAIFKRKLKIAVRGWAAIWRDGKR
jgi:hypothetical protein